jgi:hypothetical protein
VADPEICNDGGVIIPHQDILRLDVTMNYFLEVRGVKGLSDRYQDRGCFFYVALEWGTLRDLTVG